jgi:hypothetical protein
MSGPGMASNTSGLLLTLLADGTPGDLGRSSTLGTIPLVRSVEVVELEERSEG